MNSAVGHAYLYNLIILFILIVFAFLVGTLSYYKAFKVNNKIIYAIEKYEGYNSLSKREIEQKLGNLGYSVENPRCPEVYKDMTLANKHVDNNQNYKYCVYIDLKDSSKDPVKGSIYTYGVLTYMSIDLPLIDKFDIPIFTKANRLYKFT